MLQMARHSFVTAALLFATTSVLAQPPQITESLVLRGLRQQADRQCARMTEVSSRAKNDSEAAALKPVVAMACECMPSEIAKAAGDRAEGDEGRVLTIAEAGQLAARLQATCTARHLRQMLKQHCSEELPRDLKPESQEAYCACVAEQADLTPDEAWLEASVQKHEHFMAKVRAETDGQPVPPEPETVLSTIPAKCQAKVTP